MQKKPTPECNKRASAKYFKKAIVQKPVGFNRNTDADILAHLETVSNYQGYVKSLIRADMNREK